MSSFALPLILGLALSARGAAPQPGQLDASPTLFTVMAALNIAGYDADLTSTTNVQLRHDIRAELAKRNIDCLPELRKFVAVHRLKNDTLELSQYISWALSVSGPPDFQFRTRDVEVPPDAAPLKGFGPLLAVFYKEAGIEDLWKRSQQAIDNYLVRYHAPVSQAVLEVNAYLRNQTSGANRHFQVFVELLAAPNQIQTRNYGSEFTIVLTPSVQPQVRDVRHTYLHYLLDPIAGRSQEVLLRKKGLSDHAQRAPLLDESFKSDWVLLVSESLIKAVEARLDKTPQEVQEALKEGYILTPYFAEQLPAYEKQEASMQFYFPDLAKALNLKQEDARLAKVEFATQPRVRAVKPAAPPPEPPVTGAAKTLQDAEKLYTGKEYDKAKQLFLNVLQQTDERSMHAQAYYGLGRIASLQKEPEVAERLFKKTLESAPDDWVRAWTLVYLGRLAAAAGERDEALKYFQNALQVQGASDLARKMAREGISLAANKPAQP